jgi:acetoin utilization deacetylase AcuC-like enzyme
MGGAPRVGVVISAHCSTHNDGCAEGKVLGQISAGDDVFDRPVRVSELLALLEPYVDAGQPASEGPERQTDSGGAVASPVARIALTDQPVESLLEDLATSLTVVRSERVVDDRDLMISGVTSERYLQFLKQRTRELQKKQKLANKWAMGSVSPEWDFLDTDGTTLVNATTEMAARSAVGATLDALEAVLAGRWQHAFVCARPPGHHNGCCQMLEEIDKGGHVYACHGGCVLNETAIGIRHAQALVAGAQASRAADTATDNSRQPLASKRRATASSKRQALAALPFGSGCKIAVVDIDVHFGDGTALCFYDDPSVC